MIEIPKSRRTFMSAVSSLAGSSAASFVLPAAYPAEGLAYSLAAPNREGVVGRAFLQVTLFDRMPEEQSRPFFDAVDRYYTSVLLKAPGLISYQRYKHYDLPQILDLQLWDSREDALAFYDGEASQNAWKLALSKMSSSVISSLSKEYREPVHSEAHRHYILDKSLKT